MKTMKLNLITLLLLSLFSVQLTAQIENETIIKEDDGFRWTIVEKFNGKDFIRGAKTVEGKLIVPCEYSWIYYNDHYFYAIVESKDISAKALFSVEGKCIIPVDDNYEDLVVMSPKGMDSYIQTKKDGKFGVCSLDGEKLVEPKYSNIYADNGKLYTKESNGKVSSVIQSKNEDSQELTVTSQNNTDNNSNSILKGDHSIFVFPLYAKVELDNNLRVIESSKEFIYAPSGHRYVIEVVYNRNDDLHPASINLCEIDGENIILSSELLEVLDTRIKRSVKFSSKGIEIFSDKTHIVFHSDGKSITVFSTKNGKDVSAKGFGTANELLHQIYQYNYEYLETYLRKYYN